MPHSLDYAYALAIQPDGKIVAARRSADGPWRFALARYTPRGLLDLGFGHQDKVVTGFNAGAYAVASGLAVRRDGRIVAGGYAAPCTHFALAGYTARGRLDPRYTSRGVLDRSFGQGGKVVSLRGSDGDAAAVAIQRDGRIVAAGRADSEVAVARYDAHGKLDPSFGNGGIVRTDFRPGSQANAIAIEPDGKVVVAGQAGVSGDDFALARYTVDGRLDPSFGSGGEVVTNFGVTGESCPPCTKSDELASSVAVQPDGKIVAVGAGATSAAASD